MENEKGPRGDFFVKMELLEGIKIIREVKSAYALYFWCLARTTTELEFRAVRCGLVSWGHPKPDRSIADDLSQYGPKCSVEQIRRWRNILIRKGLIACKRTPIGHRIIVLCTAKFPHREAQRAPAWAEKCLAKHPYFA